MTTFTREDYEMAAKAAGYRIATVQEGSPIVAAISDDVRDWSPPEDDGDALRLMAKLRLSPRFYYGLIEMCAHSIDGAHRVIDYKLSPQDRTIEEATRRAIFRAAIAIGRAMP